MVYSHARYLNQLESMLETLEFPDGQVYQYISQLFHSACTGAYLTLATGGKLIMIPNFTVSDYVESLVREKVRAIGVIPLILQGILDEMDRKNYDLSQLKVINYSTCPHFPGSAAARARPAQLPLLSVLRHDGDGQHRHGAAPGGSPDPRRTVSHLGRTGAARRRRAHRAAGRLAVRCR